MAIGQYNEHTCVDLDNNGTRGGEPGCWLDSGDPCDTKIDYAPYPDYPDHTPVKYIKVIIHVFQLEDPNDPDYPGNFQNIPAHINIIRSWFDDPVFGVNSRLANLCDDPVDFSPHMTDARFRLIFEGNVGEDLFFHQDFEAWRTGFWCGVNPIGAGSTWVSQQLSYMHNTYVNPLGNPQNQQYDLNKFNAIHFFITGATDPPANLEIPGCDRYYCPSGATFMFSNACGGAPKSYFVSGMYYSYLNHILPGSTTCNAMIENPAAMFGESELLHILTVDHPGSNHHIAGGDHCDDTPDGPDPVTSMNMMDTKLPLGTPRCALTQCQLARAHYFMDTNSPVYLRTPDNGFAFPASLECNITAADIVIPDGADVVWNTPRRLRSNVLVESGGRLTINCDVGMPQFANMTVQKNAELIINGARIYNNCDGDFWQGIIVEGDPDEHQFKIGGIRNQGYVRTNPSTVIEGALIGVSLTGINTPQISAGGVISASETTFLNNTVSVLFARYQNFSPFTGQSTGNASRFTSCRFITDDNIGGGIGNFSSNVSMRGVDGIIFSGCTFANDFSNSGITNAEEKRYGILAYDAGFSVVAKCLGNQLPCQSYLRPEFRGFYTAIYAQNTGATVNTFRVSQTDFNDNARGIVSNGVHNLFAALNNFKVGLDKPYHYTGNPFVGIQVLRGTGYRIEENDLGPTTLFLPIDHEAVGINIISSGEEPNEVYKNNLDRLFTGNLANGKNRNMANPIKKEGLQYLCNTHSLNDFDIAVPSKTWSPGTIAENQGSSVRSAGNTFTSMPTELEGHVLNKVAPLTYFYLSGMPTNNTPNFVFPTLSNSNNTCPTRLGGGKENGIISVTEKQQTASDFNNTSDNIEKARLANILIQQALVDTNGIDLPEARVWLSNKGGLEANFAIVDTWLHEGDTDAAQQALANIPNNFALTGESQTEYHLFSNYKNLQINAMLNGMNEEQMLSANQTTISQIAGAGSYYASVQAQGLINSVQGVVYEPDVILPEGTPPQLRIGNPGGFNNTLSGFEGYLEAVPNPAKEQTTFSYRLMNEVEFGTLTIRGVDGRIVKVFSLTQNKGQLNLETASLNEGIYFCILASENASITTRKLSIVK